MIDLRAVVSPGAQLAADVQVGPFSVIGPEVIVGPRTWIGPHVVINGPTRIGAENRIFQFASIGEEPQDKKHRGEVTRLEIGDRNVFREFCTINRGTALDRGVTTIGSGNLFMAYTHVAHDCVVGDDVILANAATLGGHVRVGNWAILGGLAGVHQFCRVGEHAMVGGASCVVQDIAPYVLGQGNPFGVSTVNAEGLKRRGFSPEAIAAVRNAYKTIYRNNLTLKEAIAALETEHASASADVGAALQPLITFLQTPGRGLAR